MEIVSLPNDVWKQGPATANAAINDLINAAHPPTIAAQGPGLRYALDDNSNTITPVEHWEYDGDGDIPRRIRSLLPQTRRAALDLSVSLPSNDPHNLAHDAREYLAAIAHDARQIDWAVVYGLGVFVENAAAEAEREIADRLVPPLEGPAKKALDSLRDPAWQPDHGERRRSYSTARFVVINKSDRDRPAPSARRSQRFR